MTTLSCSNEKERVFSAFDELYYIILYDQGNEFELLFNGLNTVSGTYVLKGDTIILTYSDNQTIEFEPNEKLTKRILIDRASERVKSLDISRPFCANIHLDIRKNK